MGASEASNVRTWRNPSSMPVFRRSLRQCSDNFRQTSAKASFSESLVAPVGINYTESKGLRGQRRREHDAGKRKAGEPPVTAQEPA